MLHKTALAMLLLTVICAAPGPAASAHSGASAPRAAMAPALPEACETGMAIEPVAGEDAERKRRPRAEPLPEGDARPQQRDRRRPRPSPHDDEEGPVGCPDRNQKLELIVRLHAITLQLS